MAVGPPEYLDWMHRIVLERHQAKIIPVVISATYRQSLKSIHTNDASVHQRVST